MYRQQIVQKVSPSLLSKPISQNFNLEKSSGSLSSVVQRIQQDPKSVSEYERQQLESAIGSRSTKEILLGKQMPWVPEFQGISAQLWPDTGQADAAIQAKLTIGQPGDKYEQEADRVAADVMQRINAPDNHQVQRLEHSEKDKLQMKPIVQRLSVEGGMTAKPDLEESIQKMKGSGQPLAASIKLPMEQAFGADFSEVRIHADSQTDELARSIQARAFTTGQNLFFRQGEYQPGSRGGQELLAHELTHVVQQNWRIDRESESDREGAGRKQKSQGEKINFTEDSIIRRVIFKDLAIAEQIEIKQMINTAEKTKKTWAEGTAWDMLKWADNTSQFRSIISNYTYKEWTAVRAVFPKAKDLPSKVAAIKVEMEQNKQKLEQEAKRLYRETFTQGMKTKDAIDKGLVTLRHTSTFRTIEDKNAKKGNETGPFTREWIGVVEGLDAGWVLHIHYGDTKSCNMTAAHVKLYVDRLKTGDVVRWQSNLLPPLAKPVVAIDQVSADLTPKEKTYVK